MVNNVYLGNISKHEPLTKSLFLAPVGGSACPRSAGQDRTLPVVVWEGSSTYAHEVARCSKDGACGTWPRVMSTPQELLWGPSQWRGFCSMEASRNRWTPQAGEMPAKRDQDRGTGLKEASREFWNCHGQLHINGDYLKAEAISGFLGLLCPQS